MHGVLAPMACRSAAAHGVAAAAAVTFSRAPGGPLVQLQLPSQRCVRFSLAAAASAGSGNDAGASATPPAAPHPVRRRRAQRDVDAGRTPAVVLAAAMQRLPPGPGHVPRPLQGADGSSGTQPAPPEQPPVLLVDGYSLAFRAFHGMTARPGGGLWTTDRTPTSVTSGVLKTLLMVCKQFRPRAVLVAFDKGASFRRDLAALLAPLCEAPPASPSPSPSPSSPSSAKAAAPTPGGADGGGGGGGGDGGAGGASVAALLSDSEFVRLCKELQRRLAEGGGVLDMASLRQTLLQLLPPQAHPALDVPITAYRYKAGRAKAPIEFFQDAHNLKCVLAALRVPCLTLPHVEADDTLAALAAAAHRQGHPVLVLSSDQDLLQLVDDGRRIKVLLVGKPGSWAGAAHANKPYVEMGEAEVHAKLGVWPRQFADWRALVGDKSDNLPGVPGIGEVGATKLIHEFAAVGEAGGGIDAVYAALQQGRIKAKAAARNLAQGVRHAYLSLLLSKLGGVRVDLEGAAAGGAGAEAQQPSTEYEALFAPQGFRRDEVLPLLAQLELRELANDLPQLQALLGGEAGEPLDAARQAKARELRLGVQVDPEAAEALEHEFAEEGDDGGAAEAGSGASSSMAPAYAGVPAPATK